MSKDSQANSQVGAISAKHLSLEYPIYSSVVGGRFAEVARSFLPFSSGKRKTVLNDISFEIAPGEGVGLVGVNGAGKTTLLKVISGLVGPTRGSVSVHGRVVALLAMGVGLRHHLTGRENIWFGGLLFGMSRAEIAEAIDDIVSFADLGTAIDQPYFTYSTGMRSRLGFALATSSPGDIYILDETLATGDIRFVAKCYQRIRSIRASGKTVIFVSHNMGEIARMTKRVLVLEQGSLVFDGDTNDGLQVYESIVHSGAKRAGEVLEVDEYQALSPGIGGISLSLSFRDAQGATTSIFSVGEPMQIALAVQSDVALGPSYLNLFVYDIETGTPVCYLSPDRWESLAEPGRVQQAVTITPGYLEVTGHLPALVLGEGRYGVDVRVEPVDPATGLSRDQTRTFRAVGDLTLRYQNARFKGAGTTLEVPMQPWQVTHDRSRPET